MISKESELREAVKQLNFLANHKDKEGTVYLHLSNGGLMSLKTVLTVCEALLNTPGWPEKKEFWDDSKRYDVEGNDLWGVEYAQRDRIKCDIYNQAIDLCRSARLKEKQGTPEEIIDGFEEASHSADNSTLIFKEKQVEVPTAPKKKRKIPYPYTSQHATKKFLSS